MSNALIMNAANEIQQAMLPAETHAKTAALSSAELLRTLLAQHDRTGVADAVGLSAIAHAARAAALAVEAREAQIRAHGALNVTLQKFGLSELLGKTPLPENGPGEAFFTTGRAAAEVVTPN